jgi:hypothetical protein
MTDCIDSVVIVRLGRVQGLGGIYGRMSAFFRLSTMKPLPDGGTGKVSVIETGKLYEQIQFCVAAAVARQEHALFERVLPSLRATARG